MCKTTGCMTETLTIRLPTSMDKIAGLADIVVPGHDNFFLNPPEYL